MWFEQLCSHCKEKNWVNNGDLDDLTKTDIEAFKCHNCGEKNQIGEDEGFDCIREFYSDELDAGISREEILNHYLNCIDGKEKPT